MGQKKSWSTKLIKEFLDIESWIELLVKMDEVVKPKGKNGRPKGSKSKKKIMKLTTNKESPMTLSKCFKSSDF